MWDYDQAGTGVMTSRAGLTPVPPGQLDFSQPVLTITRAMAEQIGTNLGLDLPSPDQLRTGPQRNRARRWQASLIRAYGRPWTTLGSLHPADADKPEARQTDYYAWYASDDATEPIGVACRTCTPIATWRPLQPIGVAAPSCATPSGAGDRR